MSRFPFNDTTTKNQRPFPERSLLTPPAVQPSFPTHPNGSNDPGLRDYTKKTVFTQRFTLDAAFDQTAIEVPGTVFWISGTDNTAFMRLQIDNGSAGTPANRGMLVQNGFRLGGVKFDRLIITNTTAQAGLVLEVNISRDYPDDRVDINL